MLVDFDLTMEQPGTPPDPTMQELLQNYPANASVLMLVRKIGFAKAEGGSGNGSLLAASTTRRPMILPQQGSQTSSG